MKENQEGIADIIFVVIIVVLIGLVAFFALRNNNTDEKILLTEETVSSPTSTPTSKVWKTESLDLYNISLSIPQDWSITEINRRPEPTGPADPIEGHDCADYRITSGNDVLLTIKPKCGFASGGSNLWPDDTVIVKRLTPPKVIIRYWNEDLNAYSYSTGWDSEGTGGVPEGKLHSSPPIISYGNENLTFLSVSLTYSGQPNNKNSNLNIADEIVSSLKLAE